MSLVFTPLVIRHIQLNNRIVMPPMVIFGLGSQDGMPSEANVLHYAKRARGGVGLVIVEATCIHPDGKLHAGQLGLWEDRQIEGHQRIVDAVHVYGCPILVQIHHAGLNTVMDHPVSASEYEKVRDGKTIHARAMTTKEVHECIQWFIDASRRAYEAGYDGVELHGAHGYLLSQFLCADVNKRSDEFGGNLENRTRIVEEIIRGIRATCGENFVIGVRMGFNEPDAATSGAIIRRLEQAGMDLCHISSGFYSMDSFPDKPKDFSFSKRVYGAKLVREYAKVPTISVGEVRDIQTAEAILDAGISDCVAIGRGLLADEDLVYKSEQGNPKDVLTCLACQRCQFQPNGTICPQQQQAQRERAKR